MSLFRTSARGFAWTVGRMLAVVIVGALLAWCGIGKADASNHATREEAYAACVAGRAAMQALPSYGSMRSGYDCTYRQISTFHQYLCQGLAVPTNAAMDCHQPPSGTLDVYFQTQVLCPTGETWNDETNTCDAPNPCSDKPDLTTGYLVKGNGGQICVDGCAYTRSADSADPGMAWSLGEGSTQLSFANRWASDSAQCSGVPPERYDPSRPLCQSIGSGWMQCMQNDGRQCVSKEGSRYCWNPGETGPRQAQDGSKSANRQEQGQPNDPPENQTDPQQQGQGSSSVQNNSYTTNVYAGSGTTGGQSEPGDGGTDPTAGDGSGTGDGDGNGDGEGEGNSASGGDCATGWVCGGDPVACAILKEEHAQRCAAEKERSDIAGADTSWESPPLEGMFGDGGEGGFDLDASGWLGGGGDCPLLAGDIPPEYREFFGEYGCVYLQILAGLVLAWGYIRAGFIIGRTISGGG